MSPTDILPLVLSFVLSLVLTPAVRALARRWGAVAQPRPDRWHKKPTALLGGVAIFAAVTFTALVTLANSAQTLALLGVSAFLFFVGLVDDLRRLKPYQKLIGQGIGAVALLAAGLQLSWTPWLFVNWAITLLWLVGITNALNLLDNMDGLAAGIAAIASFFLGINCVASGQVSDAQLLGVLAAALIGFLVFNSNPASIFMGDSGSMFIGIFLAGAALLEPVGDRPRTSLPVLAVPVLVLFIPIFDVCLVTVMRKLSGRAISQGGRDHTSHRLVALGFSERKAVLLLYVLAVFSGILALLAREAPVDVSLLLIVGFTIAMTLFGIYLARVKVYA
jgi:UDP-GlcNAc:undecaprenyl-phosphate/decaprenyl-phosphate GlcNAc-1-phosphate transferase